MNKLMRQDGSTTTSMGEDRKMTTVQKLEAEKQEFIPKLSTKVFGSVVAHQVFNLLADALQQASQTKGIFYI